MDYNSEFRYKKDLIEYAADRGVSTEGTRAEIVERLEAQDRLNATEAAPSGQVEAVEVEPVEKEHQQPAFEKDQPDGGGVITADKTRVDPEKESAERAALENPVSPEAEEVDGKFLVRMTKRAKRYTYGTHVWTRANPFQLVDSELATHLHDNVPGFRRATVQEAKEFHS